MGKPLTLMAVAVLALPAPVAAEPWREEPALTALFRDAGVNGTFVLLDEGSDTLRGTNRARAEQRFSPASTFKVANALIALSLGAVRGVDEQIPYTGDANPLMREWLQPMGLRGAMSLSNVPLYQELARRIGLERMGEAIGRLRYGNAQIGTSVTTFWLRGPLAISAVEQTRFLSDLAHQRLPFPRKAQQQVAEITRVDGGPGWSLHAKTGWQNAPGAGVGWWVGWVQKGDQITPFALNIAMAGTADAPKRERLGRQSLQALGILPVPVRGPATAPLSSPWRPMGVGSESVVNGAEALRLQARVQPGLGWAAAKVLFEVGAEQPQVAVAAGPGNGTDWGVPIASLQSLQGLLQALLTNPLLGGATQPLAEGVLQGPAGVMASGLQVAEA
jgi:beta-lactamase class D